MSMSSSLRRGVVLRSAICVLVLSSMGTACGDDDGESPPPTEPTWSEVFSDLDGALVSVHGTGATDVWSVGGDPGSGPFVLHFDGTEWRKLATGETGDLWWVHAFDGGPVFMGGEGGLILRYENDAFTRTPTPGVGTVFGIWGSSPTDVWAVGGSGSAGAFAWRWDGSAWTDLALPDGLAENTSMFKVWGNSANDVWIVGSEGTILHWDGSAFVSFDSTTTRTLTTVHTTPDRVVAVGGFGSGTIVQRDIAGDFRDVSPEAVQQTMGVWLDGAEDGWSSGINGSMLRYREGRWAPVDTGFNLAESLHAVWVDPDGGVWSVGGQVLSEPLIQGIMLHRGGMIPGGTYRE